MSTINQKFVQAQSFTLAGAGVSVGDISMTLTNFNQIDGTALTMSNFGTKGFGTVEPAAGLNEEQISFTSITPNIDGTVTLGGISTILDVFPYTETSAFASDHAGAVTFVISNTAGFYGNFANKINDEDIFGVTWRVDDPTVSKQIANKEYVDNAVISGGVPASETNPGIVMEATLAEVNAGTASRTYMGTPYELYINPAKLSTSVFSNTLFFTAGEAITANKGVAINPDDGLAYTANDSVMTSYRARNYVGVTSAGALIGAQVAVQTTGEFGGLSFGSPTVVVSDTADVQQTNTTTTLLLPISNAPALVSQSFITGPNTGNISKIDVYFGVHSGTRNGNITLTVYQITNFSGGFGYTLSSSLGSVTTTQASITDSAFHTFTFASPIAVTPNTYYVLILTGTANNSSNCVNVVLNNNSPTGGGGTPATGSADGGLVDGTNEYLSFVTYYTLEQVYNYGDQVFLSGGSVSLNAGNHLTIGTILSGTSILLSRPTGETQMGSFQMPFAINSTVRAYSIPRSINVNKMIAVATFSSNLTTAAASAVILPGFSGVTSMATGTTTNAYSIFSYDFFNAYISTFLGSSPSGTLVIYYYK